MIIKDNTLLHFSKCENLSWLKVKNRQTFVDSFGILTEDECTEYLNLIRIGSLDRYLNTTIARRLNNLMAEYVTYKFSDTNVATMVGYRIIATGYVFAQVAYLGKIVKKSSGSAYDSKDMGIGPNTFNRLKPLFETLDYSIDDLAKKKFKPGDLRLVQTVMRRIFAGESGDIDV